jgi:hypothetical protein
MNEFDEATLLLSALDPWFFLRYSEHTRQWYVSSRITVVDGSVRTCPTAHRDTPQAALIDYVTALKCAQAGNYIRVGDDGCCLRWNGAAFAVVAAR